MAEQQATMSLPLDLIRPAIEAKINAAVVEALGQQDQLIMRVVEQIMNMRVSNEGKHESYDSYNKTTWLTWAVQDMTKKAIQDAIQAHIAMNAERIKEEIEAQMRKSKSPMVTKLIEAMATGLAAAVSDKYRVVVNFDTSR